MKKKIECKFFGSFDLEKLNTYRYIVYCCRNCNSNFYLNSKENCKYLKDVFDSKKYSSTHFSREYNECLANKDLLI